jgi:glutamate 5-kinase
LSQICSDVALAKADGWQLILVMSGAVARGREVIKRQGRHGRIEVLQALSAIGQGKLFQEVDERLAGWEVVTAQILLTFLEASERENREAATLTLQRLLEWGVVPVINENDTVTTDALTFGDNDYLAAQVATMLGAERLLLLTDADGVFTSDPRIDSEATLVPEIDDPDEALRIYSIGSASALGTGGMTSKLRAAQLASQGGVTTIICNGRRAGTIAGGLNDTGVGTRVTAKAVPESWSRSRKFWLEHGKPTVGRIIIDEGAERALRRMSASLLPVGIESAEGAFAAGDAVDIATVDGRLVGKGLSSFSATELRQVCRLQTAAVRERIPDAPDEAINRDSMIIYGDE